MTWLIVALARPFLANDYYAELRFADTRPSATGLSKYKGNATACTHIFPNPLRTSPTSLESNPIGPRSIAATEASNKEEATAL